MSQPVACVAQRLATSARRSSASSRPRPERVEVGLQRGRRPAVLLDEHRPLGAARQRLDPERAGARVQVEHRAPASAPAASSDREQRLAHPVGGRAHVAALGAR
jgi:hypothetical protein